MSQRKTERNELLKDLYATGKFSQRDLGELFSVNQSTVNRVLKPRNLPTIEFPKGMGPDARATALLLYDVYTKGLNDE